MKSHRSPQIRFVFFWLVLVTLTARTLPAETRAKALAEGTVCRTLLSLMLANPRTREIVLRVQRDTRLIESNGVPADDPSQATRREFVSMAADPELRRLTVDAALSDLRRRSLQIETRLNQITATNEADASVQVWDYLSIGGGIHDQIFNNVITNRNPNLKGLTVEGTDLISPNFALAEAFFRINSSTRASKAGVVPRPGFGNLNEFPGGPVQVPDLATGKFPVARSLSDAATLNRNTATADVLFRHRVAAIEDRFVSAQPGAAGWPARYRIELIGADGSRKFVYANLILNSSGLGKPKFATTSQPLLDLIAAESRPDPANPDATPKILQFEDAVRLAAANPTPYREYVDQEVAIVGTGDSAKVFIEWLLRVAPEESYGRDVGQVGNVKNVQWVGQSRKDCKDFIVNVRVRYADLAAGLKNGTVAAVDARLENIEKLPTGRYRLTYRSKDGTTVTTGEVDRIILATGFESESYKLFAPIVANDANGQPIGPTNPLENSSAVEVVSGSIPGVGNQLGIAKRLAERRPNVPAQEIYFIGPAAGVLARPEEQVGVNENVASIFALGPRTVALAEGIAVQLPAGNFPRLAAPGLQALAPGNAGSSPLPLAVPVPTANASRLSLSPYVDLYLAARLLQLCQQFRFPNGASFQLTLQRQGTALMLLPPPGLAPESALALATALQRDPGLLTLTNRFIGNDSPIDTIRVSLAISNEGLIDPIRSRLELLTLSGVVP